MSWCRFNPPPLNCVQDCLQPLSMQALPAQPESLCIVEMGGVEKQDELGEKGTIGFLYLNIGLQVSFFFICLEWLAWAGNGESRSEKQFLLVFFRTVCSCAQCLTQ